MNKLIKPIGEYTLYEIQEYCSEGNRCHHCPFLNTVCGFQACEWNLKKELTLEEYAKCSIFKATYITRNKNSSIVTLWNSKNSPIFNKNMGIYKSEHDNEQIAAIDAKFFPTVQEGDCIKVEVE